MSRPSAVTAAPVSYAIEANALEKNYGKVRALDGLSFTVQEGTVFGLLGPNGAGKTTTVKLLTTLTRADGGTAKVAGFDVRTQADRVRESIGCVTQKGQFDPEATGRENLTLQGRLYGVPRKELKQRTADLLDRFGLGQAANRLARTYSGGMQRKLDVALGLVHQPKVLFLDEPTTGLDPEARADMWRDITRLASQEGLTILLTTHYLEEADQLANRLAIVDRGTIVAAGTPEELKAELRGDAIAVEVHPDAEPADAGKVLYELDGLREVTLEDRTLRARVDNGASAVPTVLAALDTAGVGVASVTVSRPSLDDVYLRHAGRTFATAEAEEVAA
ncbi:MAG: ATP-binding cassette domain-containing protein [Pseudonocardiaceae bacterium]|nr:ATP-binding cassette domain-containing protein [Pseudonocardiaceae bacterium]